MNAYIYCADIFCAACTSRIKDGLFVNGVIAGDDSDDYPQGPYSDGGGEADFPQHCGDCGVFLENPLTDEGYRFLAEAIRDERSRRGIATKSDVLDEWIAFYRGENDEVDAAIEPANEEELIP